MTLCGAFKCSSSVVMFADRQESIANYAKWEQGKFYIYTLEDSYRVVMTGAGESDPINMMWEGIRNKLWKISDIGSVKNAILEVVSQITRKTIFPLPHDERELGYVDLIWAIQPINQPVKVPSAHIDLFRTYRLSYLPIQTHYFTGSPRLLMQFLNDQYLQGLLFNRDEAEALSTYLLFEAKEYDTYCGKYSDVFTLLNDGTLSRMFTRELDYWDNHWQQYKAAIRPLPLLTCSSDLTGKLYDVNDHIGRLSTSINFLRKERKKMREKFKPGRTDLDLRLAKELQRNAKKINKREIAKLTRLISRKSKDQQ